LASVIISIGEGGGIMTKQKQYTGEQLVFGTISVILILALVVQIFFRIIS